MKKTEAKTNLTAAAVLPSLEHQKIWNIPVRDIKPSPFQPRKEFPAEEMEQLANSVRDHGIRIPLLGRRLDPDNDTVELIAGERRLRTAQTLGLEAVPMIVQSLTDEEVIRIQRVENAGRENLKALEAAEDYLLLQSQGKTVDEITTLHGVKRSHVFTRIRVAKLPNDIKQLIKDGQLSITVADLIAKLPTEEMQQEVTKRASHKDYYGDVPSFRQMQEIINDEYTQNLADAAWLKTKSGDVDLIPGVNPCATCPKRSGNIEDAEGSKNICTDVKCYAAKQAAHTRRMLETAKAKGQTIIEPETYIRKSHTFETPADHCLADAKERTWAELAKAAKIEPSVTVYDNKLVEVFTPEQQAVIRDANKIKTTRPGERSSAADKAKIEAERKAIDEAVTQAVLSASIVDDTKPLPLAFWQRLARTTVSHFEYQLQDVFKGRDLKHAGDYDKDVATIHNYISKQASCHNLIGLIVEFLLRSKVTRYSSELLTVWGVDWKQFLPGAKAKPSKATKAAKTKAAKPAKATKASKPSKPAKAGKKGGRK